MEFIDRTTGKMMNSHRLPESVRERLADTIEWESEEQRHKITGDIDVFNEWLHNNFNVHDLEEMLEPIPGQPYFVEEYQVMSNNPGYQHYLKMCKLYPDEELRLQVAEDAIARACDNSRPLPPAELMPDDDELEDDYHEW